MQAYLDRSSGFLYNKSYEGKKGRKKEREREREKKISMVLGVQDTSESYGEDTGT